MPVIYSTQDDRWLANSYLVVDDSGGAGVLIDGNGVSEPLLERIEMTGLDVPLILLTHHHVDHVQIAGFRQLDATVAAHAWTAGALPDMVDQTLVDQEVVCVGGLRIRVMHTPGHDAGHLAFLINEEDCITGDLIFKGTVAGTTGPGATGFTDLQRSVVNTVLGLPSATRLHPGHGPMTSVGDELASNSFVLAWSQPDPPGREPCKVLGRDGELLWWGPDYDGTSKAWVRFHNGEMSVVGGSSVQRAVSLGAAL